MPGVTLASGAIFTPGGIYKGNKRVGSQFAPKFIASELPPQIESLKTVEGHRPQNSRQATLDKAAADDSGLKIGDPIRLSGERRAKTYRLVGLTELGGASFGGASIAQLTLPEAQFITDKVGRFDQISVANNPHVSSSTLAARIKRVMPPDIRVETAQQNANRQSDQIHKALSFLPIFLGVFAAVALIVGAFVIFNTFSITVAQRVREFGMLRTLGASRRQILGSVFVEAGLIGLLGSIAGIFGGLLFAKGIEALFKALGIGLPTTALVVASRTVIVSLVIGVVVTLFAVAEPGAALDPGAADRGDAGPGDDAEPQALDRHHRDREPAAGRRPGAGAGRAVRQHQGLRPGGFDARTRRRAGAVRGLALEPEAGQAAGRGSPAGRWSACAG